MNVSSVYVVYMSLCFQYAYRHYVPPSTGTCYLSMLLFASSMSRTDLVTCGDNMMVRAWHNLTQLWVIMAGSIMDATPKGFFVVLPVTALHSPRPAGGHACTPNLILPPWCHQLQSARIGWQGVLWLEQQALHCCATVLACGKYAQPCAYLGM